MAERAAWPGLGRAARRSWLRAAAVACALNTLGCTSALFHSERAPFSQAEVNRALAPVEQIKRSCYAGSTSQREKRRVQLEFIAYVNAKGGVRAEPAGPGTFDPPLLECLRQRLDELQFPAKGAEDQFRLSFDLMP